MRLRVVPSAATILCLLSVVSLADQPVGSLSPRQLWEGRFSQCSYNAVSSVLISFYGPTSAVTDREKFEHDVFSGPLDSAGYGTFYGWGPWTGYMVESGKMIWNGKPVTDLKSESFALRTEGIPVRKNRLFIVKYVTGERQRLTDKLIEQLGRGPVVMWTPYAGALDAQFAKPWHHVTQLDEETDAVPFGPFTHSVTLFLRPGKSDDGREPIVVTDCSVRNGMYRTDPGTIVSTASAMAGFVRIPESGGKSMLDRGFSGVKDDRYNVVFFKAPATQPAATEPGATSSGRSGER